MAVTCMCWKVRFMSSFPMVAMVLVCIQMMVETKSYYVQIANGSLQFLISLNTLYINKVFLSIKNLCVAVTLSKHDHILYWFLLQGCVVAIGSHCGRWVMQDFFCGATLTAAFSRFCNWTLISTLLPMVLPKIFDLVSISISPEWLTGLLKGIFFRLGSSHKVARWLKGKRWVIQRGKTCAHCAAIKPSPLFGKSPAK